MPDRRRLEGVPAGPDPARAEELSAGCALPPGGGELLGCAGIFSAMARMSEITRLELRGGGSLGRAPNPRPVIQDLR